jgi:hypothetical protein
MDPGENMTIMGNSCFCLAETLKFFSNVCEVLYKDSSSTRGLSDLTICLTRGLSYKKQELLTLHQHWSWFLVFCNALVHGAHMFSFLFCLSLYCVLFSMLTVSLDCPFLIAPLVFSNVYMYVMIIIKVRSTFIVFLY